MPNTTHQYDLIPRYRTWLGKTYVLGAKFDDWEEVREFSSSIRRAFHFSLRVTKGDKGDAKYYVWVIPLYKITEDSKIEVVAKPELYTKDTILG